MTSQQKEAVKKQMRDDAEAHQKRTDRERDLQRSNVGKFDTDLANLDSAISDNLRRTRNATTDHHNAMNQLKIAENDILREQNATHSENKKEQAKAANRELEALQSSEAANQAAMMAHQSAEKKRVEENRRQADKEAAEKIENAREQTAIAEKIGHEHDKERTEYLRKVEKDQVAEIGAMKRELNENAKLEFERTKSHQKTLETIGFMKIGARAAMDSAEVQLKKNRDAAAEISAVTDEIFELRRKMNEVVSRVKVANHLGKPSVLKKEFSMILRASEVIKTKKVLIEDKLNTLLQLNVDEHTAERQNVINQVIEDLEKLNEFHAGITLIAPEKKDDVDMEFLRDAQKYADGGMEAVESISTIWETIPPVDQKNLIHLEFMKTTGVLMNEAQLLAVKNPEVKALEEDKEEKE